MTNVASNLARVQERIADAALRVGRDPAEITLVAVTKTHPPAEVVTAYQAGARYFGENRAQEGVLKIAAVGAAISGPCPIWHMIGHVQSRKAGVVAMHFDYVHSVDRLKIARRLSRFAQEATKSLPVLLECNVSGEEAKSGFDLSGWERDADERAAFFAAVEEILGLPALTVQGLMTMAPIAADPEEVRPVFASLRALREALRERFPACQWPHLSMGMTGDFEVAIEEGATLVRIGRAIFGERG